MAANNLRIVPFNKVTAVGGTWTGTANNVLNDYRSQFATTGASTVTATVPAFVNGTKVAVIVVLTDATAVTTMSVSSTNFSATASNTGTSNNISNTTIYGKGAGQYLAAYGTVIGGSSGTTFTITLPIGTKVSKIIIGEYWTPRYNTSFGIQVGYADSSSSERTQSGDLYTIQGTRNKVLSLSLDYLDESDKFKMYDILKSNGKMTPLFISVFPQDSDIDKEQMFSIYGKFTELTNLTHSMWTIYNTNISIEEI